MAGKDLLVPGEQRLPVAVAPRTVPAELPQVMVGGASPAQASAAFLEVQQGDIGLLALNADEDMLAVKTAMLPARPVHARQRGADLTQQAGMQRLAMSLAAAASVPGVDVLEAVQFFRDQQPAPALLPVAFGAAVDQAWHFDAQRPERQQRPALAQNGWLSEGVTEGAVGVADLAVGVADTFGHLQALHAAFTAAGLVGRFDPFAL